MKTRSLYKLLGHFGTEAVDGATSQMTGLARMLPLTRVNRPFSQIDPTSKEVPVTPSEEETFRFLGICWCCDISCQKDAKPRILLYFCFLILAFSSPKNTLKLDTGNVSVLAYELTSVPPYFFLNNTDDFFHLYCTTKLSGHTHFFYVLARLWLTFWGW